MSENEVIPEAAVEAACAILVSKVHGITLDEASADVWGHERHVEREHAIELLEAAAPHLLAGAWEAGANAAWERSTPIVNGQNYQWRSSGDPINPYRSGE